MGLSRAYLSSWAGKQSRLVLLEVTLEQLRQFLLPILNDLRESTLELWLRRHFTKRFARQLRHYRHRLVGHLLQSIQSSLEQVAQEVVTPWDLQRALQAMNAFRAPLSDTLPVTFVVGERRWTCHKSLDFTAGALLFLRRTDRTQVQIWLGDLPLTTLNPSHHEGVPTRYLKQPTLDFQEGYLSLCSWVEYFTV